MRDLRGLIDQWQSNGQLKIVEGADADEFSATSFDLQGYERRTVEVTFAPARVGQKSAGLKVSLAFNGMPAKWPPAPAKLQSWA